MHTMPHEMSKRIRFGSDGNGIFVAVSRDGGKTWRLFDDERDFAAVALYELPDDELRAGVAYLCGDWHPGQPLPTEATAIHPTGGYSHYGCRCAGCR